MNRESFLHSFSSLTDNKLYSIDGESNGPQFVLQLMVIYGENVTCGNKEIRQQPEQG